MKNERTPNDPIYKQLFGQPQMVASLLRDFVPEEFVPMLDFSTLARIPGEYTTDTLQERFSDMVWEIRWKDGRPCFVAILLEFQSAPDHWMALRITSYSTLLLQSLVKAKRVGAEGGLPAVLPIVIYNGRSPWNAAQSVEGLFAPMPERIKRFCPKQEYFLLDESAVPASELKNENSLMSFVIRMEQANSVEEMQVLTRQLADTLKGPDYVALHRIFLEWTIWTLKHKGGMEKDFSAVRDLQEMNIMLNTDGVLWKDAYFSQGEACGEARGEARGREIGATSQARLALKESVEDRFGFLPTVIRDYIEQSTNTDRLRFLSRSVYKVNSLQEFTELLTPAQ